jgi:ATP-dependent Clp protease adaptor protein ClpS
VPFSPLSRPLVAAPFSRAARRLYKRVQADTIRNSWSAHVLTRSHVMMSDKQDQGDEETGVITKTRPKTARPPLYKVLLLNDDYTPMEFVVHVLERFFGMSHAQAFEIMLTVHKKGVAVVGVFSFEVAETKVAQVMDFSRRHQHPLQCTMEKE